MLRAIILDFNGVLINDEPLHARLMQETAAKLGIELTLQDYYSRYLPLDDWHCLRAVLADNNQTLEPREMERILEIKSARYEREVQTSCELFPGSVDFVRAAAARYPLAIASGARGKEIRATLERAGITRLIAAVVSADDVVESKPNPEAFLKAYGLLKNRTADLQPADCLVIEDSIHGIGGAHGAGMKVVALAHSYSAEELREADFVAEDWSGVNLALLEALFR